MAVVAFVCHGRVNKKGYDRALVPAVAKVLAKHDKVRVYYYETA